MQVTETLSQGLKREYAIVVPASDLASRLDSELADMKTKVRINGFRPGKVPMAHLKRVYGRSVMADLVQEKIDEANKQIVDERRPAARDAAARSSCPRSKDATSRRRWKRTATSPSRSSWKCCRSSSSANSTDIVAGAPGRRGRGRARSRTRRAAAWPTAAAPTPIGRKAARRRDGDRVDGRFRRQDRRRAVRGRHEREHRGRASAATPSSPASRRRCVGVKAGEKRDGRGDVSPRQLRERALAGRKAKFEMTVKAVAKRRSRSPSTTNSPRATASNRPGGDAQERIRERIAADYARASREKVKRRLLDALAERYSSKCRKGWSSRSSPRSGRRSSASSRLPAAASPTKTPPRRRREPNIARSPSGACASAWCWPRSAPRSAVQISDEEMTQRSGRPRPRLPRPGEAGLGLLSQQSERPGRAARADLRGEGRRPHPVRRQGRGPQGDGRGAAGRRRRAGPRRAGGLTRLNCGRPSGRPGPPLHNAAARPMLRVGDAV